MGTEAEKLSSIQKLLADLTLIDCKSRKNSINRCYQLEEKDASNNGIAMETAIDKAVTILTIILGHN